EEEDEEKTAQRITFLNSKSYSIDSIRRVTKNLSIGELDIRLHEPTDFNREIYNLIKEFDIGRLNFEYQNNELLKEVMVDSFFIDLTKAFKTLDLWKCSEKVTPEALHQVYKNMLERSTKCRMLNILFIRHEKVHTFLNLIGITYRDGNLFSRRDIEVYDRKSEVCELNNRFDIFDGTMEIVYRDGMDCLYFKLHETRESLEEAKNRPGTVK
ncbi:hypothetical protein PENTCL1PPCAC_12520, partial [Pristionchus entomophagus]